MVIAHLLIIAKNPGRVARAMMGIIGVPRVLRSQWRLHLVGGARRPCKGRGAPEYTCLVGDRQVMGECGTWRVVQI